MSAAIDILQGELEEQKAKLIAIRSERKDAIDAGQRAQRDVDAQSRHVNEIQDAINDLKKAQRAREFPVAA